MPGTLYVVATPIGNLEDITLRALRVLREVQVIAAEDTRRTARLLSHYSIGTPTTSLHEHNEAQKTVGLVTRLLAGENVALVSDAGTPLVSDPGAHLVRAAREAGIPVVAVPGASALLTALAASGVEANEFLFLGFAPRKASALGTWLRTNFTPPHRTSLFFEAPHRVAHTLSLMLNILGDRPILIGRELTKVHEELANRPISVHLLRLTDPRGEFTILVPAAVDDRTLVNLPGEGELADEIGQLAETEGLSTRAAVRRVAQRHGLPVNLVYRTLQRKTD